MVHNFILDETIFICPSVKCYYNSIRSCFEKALKHFRYWDTSGFYRAFESNVKKYYDEELGTEFAKGIKVVKISSEVDDKYGIIDYEIIYSID